MKRTILAVSSLTLLLAISAAAQNLFTNGYFEQGNTGFSSDYAYEDLNGTINTFPSEYSVIYNPATAFAKISEHTTGSGLMFCGDWKCSAGMRGDGTPQEGIVALKLTRGRND